MTQRMMPRSPITDDDIEDFVSDRLPEDRRRVVENFLWSNPRRHDEVKALIAQQEALRRLGADLLKEPVPERFLRLLGKAPADDPDDADNPGDS